MKSMLLASLLAISFNVHADEYQAIAADAITTSAATNAVEMNPLGFATVPLRMALVEHARTLPIEEALPITDAVSATSWGAATNNLLMLAGASTAAPVVGFVLGYVIWQSGEKEREFWRLCKYYKETDPNIKTCKFEPWPSKP
jgi:hypothetical protein